MHTNDYIRLRISAHTLVVIVPLLLVAIFYVNSVLQPPNLGLFGNDLRIFYTRKEFVPTLVSDDNQSLYYSHEGTTVTLSDYLLVFISGENSLKIVLSKTPVGTSMVYHDFAPSADWSSKDSISFFWYGAKSGSSFNVVIECEGGYYRKPIVDDWVGWKQLLISFEDMEKLSYPDLEQVKRLGFQLASGDYPDVVWRLDRVVLETINNNPVVYTVTFDGQIYIKNYGNQLNLVTLEGSFIDHAGAEVYASSEQIPSIPNGKSLINFNFTINLSGQDAPPQMPSQKYMILLRLFAQSGLKIEEIRFDVPALPYFLEKEST